MAYVFIDRVLECEPGQRIVAIKALAYNEEFFRDHFPGKPVLPGAMVLEGFVQMVGRCLGEEVGWTLHAVEQMRFNRFAVPGDVLRLEADLTSREDGVAWFSGRATAGGEGVCRLKFGVRAAAD